MGSVEARAQYHHGDLAAALRAVTLEILGEVGVEAFTLREAARRVGVNHRAVYRHFADKRALLAGVAEEGYGALAAALRAAVDAAPTGDGVARLTALTIAYLRFARQAPARYQLMFGPRLNEDGRFPSLEAAAKLAVTVLNEELRQIAPAATGRQRRDAGITLWSAIHGLTSLVLAKKVPLGERHVQSFVSTVMSPVAAGVVSVLPRR